MCSKVYIQHSEPLKSWTYDMAYGEQSTNQELYEGSVKKVVEKKLFAGFNVTVLAYGQTGSGKTYTMGTAYK